MKGWFVPAIFFALCLLLATPLPSSSAPEASGDYVIGQGDVLEVFIWRNEKLSREVVVMPDGNISLPLIQNIKAEGLTILQLRYVITQKLSQYVESPKVTVMMMEMNSYKVSVLGRVLKPGVYPVTGKTSIIEAISMAGGFTEWANKRNVTVMRGQEGEERSIAININKIISGKDPSQNILLRRGDTVIVH